MNILKNISLAIILVSGISQINAMQKDSFEEVSSRITYKIIPSNFYRGLPEYLKVDPKDAWLKETTTKIENLKEKYKKTNDLNERNKIVKELLEIEYTIELTYQELRRTINPNYMSPYVFDFDKVFGSK